MHTLEESRVSPSRDLLQRIGDHTLGQHDFWQAYGKRTFLITTLKPVPAGTEGAVSLEGTLAGVVGSIIISGFAAAAGVVTARVSMDVEIRRKLQTH